MIQLTREEWESYCQAEASGDLEAQREIIRWAEERLVKKNQYLVKGLVKEAKNGRHD